MSSHVDEKMTMSSKYASQSGTPCSTKRHQALKGCRRISHAECHDRILAKEIRSYKGQIFRKLAALMAPAKYPFKRSSFVTTLPAATFYQCNHRF